MFNLFSSRRFSPGILFAKETLWPFDYTRKTQVANRDLDVFERNPTLAMWVSPWRLPFVVYIFDRVGSLKSLKELVKCVSLPLAILSNKQRTACAWLVYGCLTFYTNGWFDQERPLRRLVRWAESCKDRDQLKVYSYDLKSATDLIAGHCRLSMRSLRSSLGLLNIRHRGVLVLIHLISLLQKNSDSKVGSRGVFSQGSTIRLLQLMGTVLTVAPHLGVAGCREGFPRKG